MPEKGSVLVDRVDLRQLDPAWWCAQLVYLPQEPTFLPSTMREAIIISNPDLEEDRLAEIVRQSGLEPYLNNSAEGLNTFLQDEGRSLPQGIRRRLALARAMATSGQLVVLDEPTESLDEAGCQAVYGLLNEFAKQGRTIIIVTRDQKIIKGATHIINLDKKPTPEIKVLEVLNGQE